MKYIILSLVLAGFALSVQAGDAKQTDAKDKPACCAKAKADADAKASCPMMGKQAKGGSCPMNKQAKETAAVKPGLASPKAQNQ